MRRYPHQHNFVCAVAASLDARSGAVTLRTPRGKGKSTALAMAAATCSGCMDIYAVGNDVKWSVEFMGLVKTAARQLRFEVPPTLTTAPFAMTENRDMTRGGVLFVDDADLIPAHMLVTLMKRCHHVFLTHTGSLPDEVSFQLAQFSYLSTVCADLRPPIDPGSACPQRKIFQKIYN